METKDLNQIISNLEGPVLIVSTIVGKGIFSIGEALREKFEAQGKLVYHVPIEELLPKDKLNEDLYRYKLISNYAPVLLNLVYRVPIFYYRKLLFQQISDKTDLSKISSLIDQYKVKTVLCASHRPAFWMSTFKRKYQKDFQLWGMLSEYGRSLGWKYIFWDQVNGFLSPVDKQLMYDFSFPKDLVFEKIDLPCQSDYLKIKEISGESDRILIIAGQWGQVFFSRICKIIDFILRKFPNISIEIICGQNQKLKVEIDHKYQDNIRVITHGQLDSIIEVLSKCSAVITKPGISTIVEAKNAGRKIFFLRGMPVAEDNNARYSILNFDAEWYSDDNFSAWYLKK